MIALISPPAAVTDRTAAVHAMRRSASCPIHVMPFLKGGGVTNLSTAEEFMSHRGSLVAIALLAMLSTSLSPARAHDESKYPNWKGQWSVILVPGLGGQNVKFDPTKPWGRGQQAPLTPEYQKVHEDSMAD